MLDKDAYLGCFDWLAYALSRYQRIPFAFILWPLTARSPGGGGGLPVAGRVEHDVVDAAVEGGVELEGLAREARARRPGGDLPPLRAPEHTGRDTMPEVQSS